MRERSKIKFLCSFFRKKNEEKAIAFEDETTRSVSAEVARNSSLEISHHFNESHVFLKPLKWFRTRFNNHSPRFKPWAMVAIICLFTLFGKINI